MGFFSKLFGRKPARYWPQFDGQPNTTIVLRQKASAFAPLFTQLTLRQVNILRGSVLAATADVDVDNFFFEWVVVSLHVADRLAFQLLGAEKRSQFFEPFEEEVIAELAGAMAKSGGSEAVSARFRELLRLRSHEYQHYDVAPRQTSQGGFDLQGSLGWKFAENVGITDPALSVVLIESVGEQLLVLTNSEFPQLLRGYANGA